MSKKANVTNDSVVSGKEEIMVAKFDGKSTLRSILGTDADKAFKFYLSLNPKAKLNDIDTVNVVANTYKVMNSLMGHFEGEVSVDASLETMAQGIRNIFKVPMSETEVNALSEEAKRSFVMEYVNQFKENVFTETIHKSGYKIVKASLDDLFYENGSLWMDTSCASVLTQDEIKILRNENAGKITTMRVVETSENGISRVLETLGDGIYVMLFVGIVGTSDEENAELNAKRLELYTNGFSDKATGIHYNFGIKGPSMDRKANALFIPAKDWSDTFNLWFTITGTKSIDGFVKAFGDEVVMAKVLARVSTRGSSSFDISRVNPKAWEMIKDARVLYSKDTETSVSKKYHQLVAPNTLEEKTNERELCDADGSGLVSLTYACRIALGLKVISGNQYAEIMKLWASHRKKGGTLASVNPNGKLGRAISAVPPVFQIRHGEKKGLLVLADLEGNCDYDIIIPESVRKFIGGEWSDYPLEICNFLSKKKPMVNLNPQFIEALSWENPNEMIKIVDDIINFMAESTEDIQKRMEFHRTFIQDDSMGSLLNDALLTDSDLMNETQIQKWSLAQYEKVISDLKIGKVPVPGMYSYMIFDPNYQLNKTLGLNLDTLVSGEYYHNGKTCECGLFRSPLIHPFEAQKVKLVNKANYWYLRDCIVFNGLDGAWDNMGGGDFDGDTCAIIPADTWQGEIIVNGIQNYDYVVWEPAQKAKKMYFKPDVNDAQAMENLIQFLVNNSKTDRTGLITNHASRALDIANHLKSAKYFAERLGCEKLIFVHPKMYGADKFFGSTMIPHAEVIDGAKCFVLKGIIEGNWKVNESLPKNDPNHRTVVWNETEESVVGTFTLDQIDEYIAKYMRLVEILRTLQGREIDGAKTGVFAEGVSGEDFTDNVKIVNGPHTMLTRQNTLGRRDAEKKLDKASINSYITLSPWGRIHDRVNSYFYNADGSVKEGTFLDKLMNNGIDKVYKLQSLLNDEEIKALSNKYLMSDGSQMTLTEMLAVRKTAYNTTIRNLRMASNEISKEVNEQQAGNVEAEDVLGTLSISNIKENECAVLESYAKMLGIPETAVAVACYIVAYSKNSNLNSGISYAWIMADTLLEVFSRANNSYGWVKVPSTNAVISVRSGLLYADETVVKPVDAEDNDSCLTKLIGGKRYAWIKRRVATVVEAKDITVGQIYEGRTFTIGAYGFRYYASQNIEGFKAIVAQNNFMFDVALNDNGRAELLVNGTAIAGMIRGNDINLDSANIIGRTVKIINKPSINENSISDIQVVVVK